MAPITTTTEVDSPPAEVLGYVTDPTRFVELDHPGDLVSAAYVGAEFAGAFVEQSDMQRSHPLQRWAGPL